MKDVDAELVAFLHDLPDGATEMIRQLTRSAAEQGAKRSSRSGWVRLGIQSIMLGGVVTGALLKYGNVATKEDMRRIEEQYSVVLSSRSSQDETQNNRIHENEKACETALTCCTHQANRIDLITAPRRP